MRGTAADPEDSEVTVVRVYGVDVTGDNDFATWQATVPLEFGENNLTV